MGNKSEIAEAGMHFCKKTRFFAAKSGLKRFDLNKIVQILAKNIL